MQLYSAVMELYIFSSVGAVTPDLTLIIVIHQNHPLETSPLGSTVRRSDYQEYILLKLIIHKSYIGIYISICSVLHLHGAIPLTITYKLIKWLRIALSSVRCTEGKYEHISFPISIQRQ